MSKKLLRYLRSETSEAHINNIIKNLLFSSLLAL